MTETLAHGYSFDSTQRELSNEYQHDRVKMFFRKALHHCALDEIRLSIGRVKAINSIVWIGQYLTASSSSCSRWLPFKMAAHRIRRRGVKCSSPQGARLTCEKVHRYIRTSSHVGGQWLPGVSYFTLYCSEDNSYITHARPLLPRRRPRRGK